MNLEKYKDSKNNFSYNYYESILKMALDNDYKFVTLSEFKELNCPNNGYFIIRHDIDKHIENLVDIFEIEKKLNIKSTYFVRITANNYNFFSYNMLPHLIKFEKEGNEIGLHTNFVEYSAINKIDPFKLLKTETYILKQFFNIKGIAPHRDINYIYNSLPFIKDNINFIKELGYKYHSYEEQILNNTIYVNEGFNTHLCWRNKKPEDIIPLKKSIYLLTHNHWWYRNNPFERYD